MLASGRRLTVIAVAGLALATGACGSSGPTTIFEVPTGAMLPTFKVDQLVRVSLRASYVPRVGDIVAFHPPAGADGALPVCGNHSQGSGHAQACALPTSQPSVQILIRRVVAGPGDVIKIIDGHVYRNGAREQDTYTEPCGGQPGCTFSAPITIPPGDYFVLGDNRSSSDDSRSWGPVPGRWIIGKVQ